MEVKKGIWVSKEDPSIKIIIERVYKKKETVNYFYFMCRLTGGGTLHKDKLLSGYTYQNK